MAAPWSVLSPDAARLLSLLPLIKSLPEGEKKREKKKKIERKKKLLPSSFTSLALHFISGL